MKRRTILKGIIFFSVAGLLIYGIHYCWISFPIACGYGAKVLCSAVFVAGRKEESVKAQELSSAPLNLVSYRINYGEASVTTSLFGWARRKAVFRKGLGATLLSEMTEDELRKQQFSLSAAPAAPAAPWPLGEQLSDPLPAPVDKEKLEKHLENIFHEKDSSHPAGTRAVVVVYDGHLVAEKYAAGFDKSSRLTGWSMTKSITGALIGILVQQNKLNIDQPAPVPEWISESDPRHAITVKHLLQQSSGLQFVEDYSKSSDATRMLFQKGDMGKYAAMHALKNKPGTEFYYSSGNTNILSRIIRHVVGDAGYHSFPYKHLFYKLGMYSIVMEPDASGTFVGSSYSFATARDWARFGLLYLNDGVFRNERILPEGWVRQTLTPAPAATKGEHGFQFWLNRGPKGHPAGSLFPSLPSDMAFADGFEGQNIFIIPSKKLVVVRLGFTKGGAYDVPHLVTGILETIKE